jgi:crotonobetainyl-CoA:carnitine CoA-transferase CaiB-like acyl-CoA transferase
MKKNNSALSDLTVLDLSRLLPGPYCSMILADHGARVIAVEDKRFMADGHFINMIYRNKEHISLDLKTQKGKEIFFKLARKADIVMEGFRPGVTARLGIDYETVKGVNPQIIYCSITGYGQTGPYRDRVGHDANYLGIAGVLDLIGETDKPPSIPGVQFADIAGGGMNGALGILLALHARERTGKGQYIDISMTDAMAGLLPLGIFFQQATGNMLTRSDNILSHHYAFYNTFETKDKKYLTICAVEHKFWKTLCELLEVPEYAPLQYDENRRIEIIDFMRNTFKQQSLEEWTTILGELDIAWGPIHNLKEAMQDQHLKHREMFSEFENEHGNPAPTIGIPVKLSETPGSLRSQPPTFGKNTKEVLAELGYAEGEIKALFEENIV